MIQDDILELTLHQVLFDTIPCTNVIHYRVANVGVMDESGLLSAFAADVSPVMRGLQSSDLAHVKYTVLNLSDDLGYADTVWQPPLLGAVAGSDGPPFVTFAFRKNRNTRRTRSGQMRVAGVVEGASEDGILSGAFEDDVNALATALGQLLQDGTGGTYVPVIVSKAKDGTMLATNAISSFEYTRIGTQNSRKYGV